MKTYACKLCGRTFTGPQASFALRGHTSHCRRQAREAERDLLDNIAEAARAVVGERYNHNEALEIIHLRVSLDTLAKLRKEVECDLQR